MVKKSRNKGLITSAVTFSTQYASQLTAARTNEPNSCIVRQLVDLAKFSFTKNTNPAGLPSSDISQELGALFAEWAVNAEEVAQLASTCTWHACAQVSE